MNHDSGVGQRKPLLLLACGEQDGTHAGGLADAESGDVAAHELHGVVDRETCRHRPAWRVDVNVNGDIVEISSRDIELAGLTATRMEQLTRVTRRDRRVFQDGIFIIEKAGKVL